MDNVLVELSFRSAKPHRQSTPEPPPLETNVYEDVLENIPDDDRYLFDKNEERWFNPLMAVLQSTYERAVNKLTTSAVDFITNVKAQLFSVEKTEQEASFIATLESEFKTSV